MKPASVKLLPVGYPVYQAIAELNRSFAEAAQTLDRLSDFNLFRPGSLQSCRVMLEEIRALTNQELTELISDREFENCAYFERLRLNVANKSDGPRPRPASRTLVATKQPSSAISRGNAVRGRKVGRP